MPDYKINNESMYRVQSEIQKSADNVDSVEHIANRNETYVETLRVEFLRKICPNSIHAAKLKGEIKLVETEFEFRKRVLQLVREHQLQALQEIHNQYLAQGKTAMRQGTTIFMLEKRIELERALDDKFAEFIESRIPQYERAETIPVAALKKMELERLDSGAVGFKDLADSLVKEFSRIVDEAIKV